MKTSDFVKKVEELGFTTVNYKGYLEVQEVRGTSRKLIAMVKTSSKFYVDTARANFELLDKYTQERLFKLLIDYVKSPIKEREAQKKYHLKLKAAKHFGSPSNFYLNKTDYEYMLSDCQQSSIYKTEFTQEEIDNLPSELIAIFDKVEVENEN